MPYAELSTGVRLFYEDEGEGEPVILIHGWLGTARADLQVVLDWLSADYRVIGPTMRGYGQSRPPQRDYPIDHYQRDARDILALMDALNIPIAHIMGYSDGGEVALLAAGFAPERFKSVAVWGAIGYYGPEMRPLIQRTYPPDYLSAEEIERNGITNPDAFVLGWARAAIHIVDSGGDLSLSLAPKIACPLILMLGDQDRLNPAVYGQKFVDNTPNGQMIMFQCGHPIHNQQTEQFKRVVGAFLDRVKAESEQR